MHCLSYLYTCQKKKLPEILEVNSEFISQKRKEKLLLKNDSLKEV